MRVAVFGATGKAGRRVVAECRSRNWEVTAVVRDRTRYAGPSGVDLVEGDAREPGVAERAAQGADAVLCCLGMQDISVPATDFSDSVKAIVQAMEAKGPRRYLMVITAGVLPHPTGGYRNKEGLSPAMVNVAAEHVRNYETLLASKLDWTAMCPLGLSEDLPAGHGRIAFEDLPPGSSVTGYADLAQTMVELIGRRDSFGKRVGIVSDRAS